MIVVSGPGGVDVYRIPAAAADDVKPVWTQAIEKGQHDFLAFLPDGRLVGVHEDHGLMVYPAGGGAPRSTPLSKEATHETTGLAVTGKGEVLVLRPDELLVFAGKQLKLQRKKAKQNQKPSR